MEPPEKLAVPPTCPSPAPPFAQKLEARASLEIPSPVTLSAKQLKPSNLEGALGIVTLACCCKREAAFDSGIVTTIWRVAAFVQPTAYPHSAALKSTREMEPKVLMDGSP